MPLDYPIHRRTLPNGLRVVVSPDHTVPNVTLNLWVGVGSRHETQGRTGFAHLFEHLMFQGSRNVRSGEHFEALMAEGGRLNATTWFDRTNYFETVPTGAVELALWLEADRHAHLLDAVTQENLDNQRDVVKEEKRQRYDNQPYGNALIDVYAAVFPEGHPYHHPTIGSMEDLDAASLEDVHAFFRRSLRPRQHRPHAVRRHHAGGGVRPRGAVLRRPAGEHRAARARTTTSSTRSRSRCASTAARSCPTTGCTSRSASRSTRPTSSSPRRSRSTASEASRRRGSSGGWSGASRPRSAPTPPPGASSTARPSGSSCSTSRRASTPTRSRRPSSRSSRASSQHGPTEVELEASLAQSERSWLSALASQEERADLISHHLLLHDDPEVVNTHLDRLRAVTAEQVVEAARRWLRPESRAVVAYLVAGDASDGAEQAERTDEEAVA